MKKILAFTIAAVFLVTGVSISGAAQTRRKRHSTKTSASMTQVKVCPINGEPVNAKTAPSEVVGNYKVYFCCASHKSEFNQLSAEEKQQKINAALEKQNAGRRKS